MADIFISHSSQDNILAGQIGERIKHDRLTWSVFYDVKNIRAGQKWQQRLREELQSCRVVLAVLSRDWLASPWCFTEAVTAAFRGKDFVGIETEDLAPADFGRAPPILQERQRVRLRDGDERAWQEILEALDHSGLDPNDWFPIPSGVGPYPGIVSFDEKDAGVFFGRKQEITDYLAELDRLRAPDRSQVLVISGGSGSGKSSLLRAGLLPRLRQKPEWRVITPFEVGREPVRNLLDRLSEALTSYGLPTDQLSLHAVPADAGQLVRTLDEVVRRLERGSTAWVLLPLDQAEALVAGQKPVGEAALLLDALALLLARRTRRLIVAATIRTEFVPRLEDALGSEEVRLRYAPLGPIRALAEVIEKPADRFGIMLGPGLASQIVEDVRTADALPLLAYTLRQLWEQYGRDGAITIDDYNTLGGVKGAIRARLHDAMSDPEPTPDELAALRRAFTRHMIRVDEGAAEGERYLRRVANVGSLPTGADERIRRLIAAGLLTTKGGTIELAHERLIDDWAPLPIKRWLTDDSADRSLIDLLRERVADETLSDDLLARSEALLGRDSFLAKEEPEIALLVARAHQTRKAADRQRRRFLGSAIVAAIIFAIVAGVAWLQWDEAERQTREVQAKESLLLAQLARSEIDRGDAVTGSLIALQGLPPPDRPYVPEAHAALVQGLYAQQELRDLRGHEDSVLGVAFAPNGKTLASASGDKTLRLWEVASGRELRTLRGHEDTVHGVAFAPDGKTLASASGDKTLRLWWAPQKLEDLIAEAHKRLPRQLTREQEERFYLTPTNVTADAP